jgi:hypothetical protein
MITVIESGRWSFVDGRASRWSASIVVGQSRWLESIVGVRGGCLKSRWLRSLVRVVGSSGVRRQSTVDSVVDVLLPGVGAAVGVEAPLV